MLTLVGEPVRKLSDTQMEIPFYQRLTQSYWKPDAPQAPHSGLRCGACVPIHELNLKLMLISMVCFPNLTLSGIPLIWQRASISQPRKGVPLCARGTHIWFPHLPVGGRGLIILLLGGDPWPILTEFSRARFEGHVDLLQNLDALKMSAFPLVSLRINAIPSRTRPYKQIYHASTTHLLLFF